jgi:alpha-glucosidase
MENLRAHLNTQMHMSLIGMDYYGSDIGGFLPSTEPNGKQEELYTQWLANSALLDIPLRPHAWAYGETNENIRIGPDQRGHRESNRANVVLRYELTPYLYSLSHRARESGEPVFPPLVYHFQIDKNVRKMGNVKMIGDSLLFGVVAAYGQTERQVYLPSGRWTDYHSLEWYNSTGQETPALPLYRQRLGQPGLFTIPLFARAGAIMPVMYVDEKTRNVYGRRNVNPEGLSEEDRRRETIVPNELRAKIFAGEKPTSFTLYEDDGTTLDYLKGNIRRTVISQQANDDSVRVVIGEGKGTFHGAVSSRANMIELVVDGRLGTAVELNGSPLTQLASATEFESGKPGWYNAGPNLIRARSELRPVIEPKTFVFRLSSRQPARTSVQFVCSGASASPGEAVFVTGNMAQLGSWDPEKAVRLLPLPYRNPNYPWVGTVTGLPPNTRLEWKCIKRKEEGGPVLQWEHSGTNNVIETSATGFSGSARGHFRDGS